MWLVVIILLSAFDKHVPWYVWTLWGLELLLAICYSITEKLGK